MCVHTHVYICHVINADPEAGVFLVGMHHNPDEDKVVINEWVNSLEITEGLQYNNYINSMHNFRLVSVLVSAISRPLKVVVALIIQ